jgi:hypothetical protein
MKRLIGMGLAALVLTCMAGTASAAPIAYGTYTLNNHPNPLGTEEPPYWGLRLDEYVNVTAGDDVFTWDFDDPMSDMKLDYASGSIHIYGTSWGGLDDGLVYNPNPAYTGLYTIDFWYVEGVAAYPDGGAWDDVRVKPLGDPNLNLGSISGPAGDYALTDFTMNNTSFQLGDTPVGAYRGYAGISGWGWLAYYDSSTTNPEDAPYVDASDWQFIATPYVPVPEPLALLFMGVGLLGVWMLSIRKSNRNSSIS